MELPAIASAVGAVLGQGHKLVDLIITLKYARSDIEDRAIKIESYWRRTQVQLDFAQSTWSGLREEHQASQLSILSLLQSKIKTAERRVEGLLKKQKDGHCNPDSRRKIKLTKYLLVKPYLDSLIDELAEWSAVYDPSWFLIMKIANPKIDDELKRLTSASSKEATVLLRRATKVRAAISKFEPSDTHIFLSPNELEKMDTRRVPHSQAMIAHEQGSSTSYIVDSIPCPGHSNTETMTQDIRRLARKLRAVDPAVFGVLRCRGVVKMRHVTGSRVASFDMIFDTPSPGTPMSLRNCLLMQQPHSLTDRFSLAKRIATSVNYVHTLAFVHKGIRPENFISFLNPTAEDDLTLDSFYLIGFEQVRSEDGNTYLRGSANWEQNMYRHPERQGSFPEERYKMQHDIYSLGVCLLEIGLWNSFVMYDNNGRISGPGRAFEVSASDLLRFTPGAFKDLLVGLAKRRLPPIMGNTYTEVVVDCLTCLDADNDEYEEISEAEDQDGVVVGVKFINQVLLQLNEISV
ncbi:hypothetical protein CB0940_04481 [Cercospora beticola]|uniref:Protein kinase domain-containing protein n=1 Tax=Cercospora beticola TaxID=122368 RepID=A0A2G5HKL7_CERBT|nr:hypothetical protein CB0940_04481 [Cercospora beticola]PIA92752.1 hypothetical protein CB0940_04481 [Cercospora beticola]WPB01725.1 hypothetical protein RHO25_006356 [Cercospora beticola]